VAVEVGGLALLAILAVRAVVVAVVLFRLVESELKASMEGLRYHKPTADTLVVVVVLPQMARTPALTHRAPKVEMDFPHL
jgi:hypothetical protein